MLPHPPCPSSFPTPQHPAFTPRTVEKWNHYIFIRPAISTVTVELMTGGLTLFLCKTFTCLVPYGCLIWNVVLNYLLSCVKVSLGAIQAVLACCCLLWSWCALFTTVEFLKRVVAGCATIVVFRNASYSSSEFWKFLSHLCLTKSLETEQFKTTQLLFFDFAQNTLIADVVAETWSVAWMFRLNSCTYSWSSIALAPGLNSMLDEQLKNSLNGKLYSHQHNVQQQRTQTLCYESETRDSFIHWWFLKKH